MLISKTCDNSNNNDNNDNNDNNYLYIYKTEASETLTIFHMSTIFK